MSQMEFIEAIRSGNRSSVEEMIKAGIDLSQQDKQGWTPLNWAAGSGHLEMVELLLENGADPLAVGRDLRTPQMVALAAGHVEVVKRLRRAEATAKDGAPEISDRRYCTAFHLSDLRRYSAWSSDIQDLSDEDVVFLHGDYTVTKSIWTGEDVVFDKVTDDWKEFCKNDLRFAVPDNLDLIAKPAEAAAQSAA